MLTGLADLALSYSESHVTPHLGPKPPELQLGDHPLDSCVSLFVVVPNQLPVYGSRTDHPPPFWVSGIGG